MAESRAWIPTHSHSSACLAGLRSYLSGACFRIFLMFMGDGSYCCQRWVSRNCELVLEPATVLKDHRLLNGNKVISVCAYRIFVNWLLFAKHDVPGNFAGHGAVPLSKLDLMTYWKSLN